MAGDPYTDAKTGVLINKLGINDARQLATAERALTRVRLLEVKDSPIKGNFDLAHLQDIHKHVFQDLYSWAGELRTVPIAKGNSVFALPEYIKPEGDKLFAKLAGENHLKGMFTDKFVERAAFYLSETNALHAFREGNGRTQRAFFEALGQHIGRPMDFSATSAEQNVERFSASFHRGGDELKPFIREGLRAARAQGFDRGHDRGR